MNTFKRVSLVKVTESNILFEGRAEDCIFKEDHGNSWISTYSYCKRIQHGWQV